MLQHVYSPIRGRWTLAYEQEFQQLRALEPAFSEFQNDPVRRAALLRDAPAANWNTAMERYNLLRFARLCEYLRVRPPEATVGFSIFIYQLSATELDAAVGGTLQQWRQLIEEAIAAGGKR